MGEKRQFSIPFTSEALLASWSRALHAAPPFSDVYAVAPISRMLISSGISIRTRSKEVGEGDY
jgi:hypothetical protein